MDMVMPGDGDRRIREFKMVFINIASSIPALVTQEFFFISIVIRWYHMYTHLQHFYIFSYLHVLNCMFFSNDDMLYLTVEKLNIFQHLPITEHIHK